MKRVIGLAVQVITEIKTEWHKANALAEMSYQIPTKESHRKTLLNPWRF